MSLHVGAVVIRVDDLDLQAEFWQEALKYERRVDDDDDFVHLFPADGHGPHVSLDRLRSEAQVPPRIHLDLYADDQTAEIERLVGLGASVVPWDNPSPTADYVVLEDPEGNRFCIIDKS